MERNDKAAAAVVASAVEALRDLGYKVTYQLDFGKRGKLMFYLEARVPRPLHVLIEELIEETKTDPEEAT